MAGRRQSRWWCCLTWPAALLSELLTAQPSENSWFRLWIARVWCARFEGPHDSYRVHFCRRHDGADCLASDGDPCHGCTQGAQVNAAGIDQPPQITA
jgi:hypothetical protein